MKSFSVFSASALCDAHEAFHNDNLENFHLLVEKAYGYVSKSRSAVLRYWISIFYARIAQDESRHAESIEASQNALAIAIANDDVRRQIDSRAVLSISEVELKFYDDALENSAIAIKLQEAHSNQYDVAFSLLRDRGYILNRQGEVDKSKEFYTKAIV